MAAVTAIFKYQRCYCSLSTISKTTNIPDGTTSCIPCLRQSPSDYNTELFSKNNFLYMDKHIKVSKYFKSTDLLIEVALRSLTLQYVQDSWGLPGKKKIRQTTEKGLRTNNSHTFVMHAVET